MNFKIAENLKTKKETYYVNNKKVSEGLYFSKIRECMMKNLSYNSSVVFSTKRTRYYLSSYDWLKQLQSVYYRLLNPGFFPWIKADNIQKNNTDTLSVETIKYFRKILVTICIF